ncbi:hypothetical protein [Nostoc sp.]|uniref:hypothetical protein n=1 Tax=Nostoc sp. TaxID=1180 RepID=UPI002FFBB523
MLSRLLGVVFAETFSDRTLVDERIAIPLATSSLRDAARSLLARKWYDNRSKLLNCNLYRLDSLF